MNRIVTQSLFGPANTTPRSWQSYLTSGAVHIVGIAVLLSITFPAVQEITRAERHVTLIAPVLPAYKPKVIQRPIVPPPVLRTEPIVKDITPPKRLIPPPVVKPPELKPQVLAKAPEIKEPTVTPHDIPEAKIAAPPLPKPEIHTGVFAAEQAAKSARLAQQLKVGGFGDPNGATAVNAPPTQLQMAKLGGFDLPNGATPGGGGGHAQTGAVRSSGFGDSTGVPGKPGAHGAVSTGGFGSSGDANGVPGGTGTHGTVRTGGFGDSSTPGPPQAARERPLPLSNTPVEILFKPKPSYTDEAKSLRLEGQVALEVVFLANGSIKVVRVVHGLGHGLDEAAQQAATQVRFKPATRGGSAVDTNATIYITFQLT